MSHTYDLIKYQKAVIRIADTVDFTILTDFISSKDSSLVHVHDNKSLNHEKSLTYF